jgi:hypothetical protein
MKLNFINILLLIYIITFSSCGTFSELFMKGSEPFQENFDNEITFKNNWENNSWKSPVSYSLGNNKLKITTRAATKDRVKVRTKRRNFTTGSYAWWIFVPEFKFYQQINVSAFLYHNWEKVFEFDFDIGSGQKLDWEKISLKKNETNVFCISRFSPSNSGHFVVKWTNILVLKWSYFMLMTSIW